MKLWVYDARGNQWKAVLAAAARIGMPAQRIMRGEDCGDGLGFFHVTSDPAVLPTVRRDYDLMAARCDVYQDRNQIEMYEDKSAQFARWGEWMPDTWRFTDEPSALALVDQFDGPLVSKSDVGNGSANVWVLQTKDQAREHVRTVFRKGVRVSHGAAGATSKQRGYVLLQRFVPHEVTWRVNAIGRGRSIFKRHCYPDRPVAQTGNTEVVAELDDEMESLLEYADRFFAACGTRWSSIDVLRDGDGWVLLEMSPTWPWPGVGHDAPIFRTDYLWPEMFDCMLDEWLNAS